MRVRRTLLGVAVLVSVSMQPLWPQPELESDASGNMTLKNLPSILNEPDLERYLLSGLTTTVVVRIENDQREVVGGLRVDLRYELWDEIFFLTVLDLVSTESSLLLDSGQALNAWWKVLKIPIVESVSSVSTSELRVTLTVVPFSRTEQDDTQRWYAESVHRGAQGSETTAGERRESLERVFSVLIATSIQRRPLGSYSWRVRVPEEKRVR